VGTFVGSIEMHVNNAGSASSTRASPQGNPGVGDRVGGSQTARGEEEVCTAATALGGGAQLHWLARFRRLSRDFERMPQVLAALHFVVFAMLMLPKAVTF